MSFNEQQEKVFEVLFEEARGDLREAMRLAGYNTHYSTKAFLQNEGVAEEIRKRTLSFLASSGPKAAYTIYGLLEGKGKLGDKEKLAAAKDLLDRADFKTAEKVEVEVNSPLFILPPKEETD